MARRLALQGGVLIVAALGVFAPAAHAGCHKGDWCSAGGKGFVVWVHGTGNQGADHKALASTKGIVGSLWGPETGLMGDPLSDVPRKGDDGNDDKRIDVYLVGPQEPVKRAGVPHTVVKGAEGNGITAGRAVPVPAAAKHAPGPAFSALMLLRRDRLDTPKFRSDVAHELFHVMQYAHNGKAPQGGDCGGEFWFREASAEWAETYFVPRSAALAVYQRVHQFQIAEQGLDGVDGDNEYNSFMWPYFMQQEVGADAIAAVWRDLETARTCDEYRAAIDAQLPFADNFRRFAIRNLNSREIEGSDPLTPRYQGLHSDFPFESPVEKDVLDLTGGLSTDPPTELNPAPVHLRAAYEHLIIHSDVEQLVIDPSDLGPTGSLDVDAVVHQNGRWDVRPLDKNGPTKICREDGPFDDVWLVVSNHAQTGKPLAGTVSVRPINTPCSCPDPATLRSFDATGSFSFDRSAATTIDGTDYSAHMKHSGTAMTGRAERTTDVQNAAFSGPMTGASVAVHDAYTQDTTTQTVDGNLFSEPESAVTVQFDLPNCTYQVAFDVGTRVTATDPAGPPYDAVVDTVLSPALPIPASFDLGGTATGNAYVTLPLDYAGAGALDFHAQPMSLDLNYVATGGEGPVTAPLGSASMSWHLIPTFTN